MSRSVLLYFASNKDVKKSDSGAIKCLLKTVERAGALDKPQRLANCVETDNDTDAGHTDANISVIKKGKKNPRAHVFVFFSPRCTCAFVFYNLSRHMAFTCEVLEEGGTENRTRMCFFL